MAKKYDDFDEADSDGIFAQVFGIISRHRKGFAVVTVTAAVLLLGLIIWDSYPDGASDGSESVPIVRADSGEYKTAPDNPGGMEVPYRDSTVFSSNEADGGTENILADESSEQPVSRESAFAGLNTESEQPGGAPAAAPSSETAASQPMGEVEATQSAMNSGAGAAAAILPPSDDALVKEAIGTSDTLSSPSDSEIATEATPAPAETAMVDAPPMPEPVKPDASKTEPSKIEPAAGTTSARVTPGGYYVQLASVKSTAGAAAEYKKIQAKYSALSGVKYRTQEANLGAKGTFYRIQAGPMSKDSAGKICGSIKSGGGSCLVTGK